MANTAHSTDKGTDEQLPVFGYDQRGRAHRYDAVRATVVVTLDGETVHEEQLAKPAVPEWIQFVDEKCGWIDQWWQADVLPVERHRSATARAADIRYERAIQEAGD